MRRNPFGLLVSLSPCLLVFLASPAGASEKDAREIVERAIKAQGGATALGKALQCKRTDTGAQTLQGRDLPFVSYVTRSLPEKMRLEIELNRKVKTLVVLNGERGWQSDGGPAVQLLSQRVKELREEAYLWWLTTLVPLTKPGFTLSTIPDSKVEGDAAAGIKVASRGHHDVRMYFSKRTGMLVKIECQLTEGGLKVDKEYFYSGYRDFDGARLHTKELVKVNGQKWTAFTISDYSFPDKLDGKTFNKP
jgi:hypothetical protein